MWMAMFRSSLSLQSHFAGATWEDRELGAESGDHSRAERAAPGLEYIYKVITGRFAECWGRASKTDIFTCFKWQQNPKEVIQNQSYVVLEWQFPKGGLSYVVITYPSSPERIQSIISDENCKTNLHCCLLDSLPHLSGLDEDVLRKVKRPSLFDHDLLIRFFVAKQQKNTWKSRLESHGVFQKLHYLGFWEWSP